LVLACFWDQAIGLAFLPDGLEFLIAPGKALSVAAFRQTERTARAHAVAFEALV
jgi:hypothetical protein